MSAILSRVDRAGESSKFLAEAFEADPGMCTFLCYQERCDRQKDPRTWEAQLVLILPDRRRVAGYFRWVLIDLEWIRVANQTGELR